MAYDQARAAGNPHPQYVAYVASHRKVAVQVSEGGDLVDSNQPVWVVEVVGPFPDFIAPTAPTADTQTQNCRALTFTVERATWGILDSGCGASFDLGRLGQAHPLLPPPPLHQSGGAPPFAAPEWSWRIRGWRTHLRAAVKIDPSTRYPTPALAILRHRLAEASSRYHFQVVSLRFVRAPQGSPLLIVQSDSPSSFSRNTAAIISLLDSRNGNGPGWEGFAYEGFFLGAQDSRGRPFLDASQILRIHEGGQWARAENLYPFPHG
jgi:hypothetical protein